VFLSEVISVFPINPVQPVFILISHQSIRDFESRGTLQAEILGCNSGTTEKRRSEYKLLQ
jgi:hypothetical protein